MNKNKHRLPVIVTVIALCLTLFAGLVTAATPPTVGSITVHKLANETGTPVAGDGSVQTAPAGTTPLAGATYTLVQTHKVDANGNTVALEPTDTAVTITLKDGSTADTTTEDGVITFGSLPFGRYALTETAAPDPTLNTDGTWTGHLLDPTTYAIDVPLVNDTTTIYDINVYPKNPELSVGKTQRAKTADAYASYLDSAPLIIAVGEAFDYQMTVQVPPAADISGGRTYTTLVVADTLPAGIALSDMAIAVTGTKSGAATATTLVAGTDYTLALTNATDGTANTAADVRKITFTLDAAKIAALSAGSTVTISFKAVLTNEALIPGTESTLPVLGNAAVATLGSTDGATTEPLVASMTGTTPTTYTQALPGSVTLTKVDATDLDKRLQGATFTLYKADTTATGDIPGTSPLVKGFAVTDSMATTGTLSKITPADDAATSTVNELGVLTWSNLAPGSYYLVENQAPASYNTLTAAVPVSITVPVDETTTSMNPAVTIQNVPTDVLPATGGLGTIILTTLGVLVLLYVIWINRRRPDDEKQKKQG